MYNTSVKSVTPVQITTNVSKVSPKKLVEPLWLQNVIRSVFKITEVNPKSAEDYRRVPKITRRLPRIFEENTKIFEGYQRFLKIMQRFPKITGRLPKITRRLPKISGHWHLSVQAIVSSRANTPCFPAIPVAKMATTAK